MSREDHPSIQQEKTKAKNSFRRSVFYYPGARSSVLWTRMDPLARNFSLIVNTGHASQHTFKNTTEYDLTLIA